MSLGAVLFDPKTQTYFVPNTSKVQESGKNDAEKDEKSGKNEENDNENAEKGEPNGNENIEKEDKKKGGEKDEV